MKIVTLNGKQRQDERKSEHRYEYAAISGLGKDAVAMETARDDGWDTPLVVVPARVTVEVAQLVHSIAAEMLVEWSRCAAGGLAADGTASPRQGRQVTDD